MSGPANLSSASFLCCRGERADPIRWVSADGARCRPPEASETREACMDLAPAVGVISLRGPRQLAGTSRTLVREFGVERERVADSVAAHQLETRRAPTPELPGERCASLSAPSLASGRRAGICTEQGTGMRGRGRFPVLRPGVPQREPGSPRRSRRGPQRPPAGPEGVRESSSGHIGRRLRQNSSLTQDVPTGQTGVLHFAALRAAVPTPTGRTGRRSGGPWRAAPCG